MASAGNHGQVSNTKLNKNCRALLGISYADEILQGIKFCDGRPVLEAYHLFAAIVKAIVRMVSNPEFNVNTLVFDAAEENPA